MKDRVALITGGSRGIGRETALVLARKGVDVCVLDVLETETTVQLVKDSRRKALGVRADVSKSQEVKEAVKSALDHFGRIDILVNNAAIARKNEAVDIPEEEWDLTLAVNLKGAFLCSKAVLPTMIDQRYGRIVCISSMSGGWFGVPKESHYSASKAGVIGFVKTLAQEVAPYGITVNAIGPGIADTDMTRSAVGVEGLKNLAKVIPLGRVAQPREIASVVAFFASEEAGFITGQFLLVDGGLSLGTWWRVF